MTLAGIDLNLPQRYQFLVPPLGCLLGAVTNLPTKLFNWGNAMVQTLEWPSKPPIPGMLLIPAWHPQIFALSPWSDFLGFCLDIADDPDLRMLIRSELGLSAPEVDDCDIPRIYDWIVEHLWGIDDGASVEERLERCPLPNLRATLH